MGEAAILKPATLIPQSGHLPIASACRHSRSFPPVATDLAAKTPRQVPVASLLSAVRVDDARLRWTLSAAVCTDRRMTAATVLLDALTRQSRARPQQPAPLAAIQRPLPGIRTLPVNWSSAPAQASKSMVWLLERYSAAYASNQFRALQQFFK